jgi:hypothetical protein
LGAAFVAFAGVFWWRDRETVALVAATIGLVLLATSLVAPTRLLPIERGWMAFARAISKVTTPIIMGLVYFLVVFPIGMLMRLVGRKPLKPALSRGSFWVSRVEEEGKRGGMRHQF